MATYEIYMMEQVAQWEVEAEDEKKALQMAYDELGTDLDILTEHAAVEFIIREVEP